MSHNNSSIGLALTALGVAGAVTLVVSLSLDWYSLTFEDTVVTLGGWSALEFGDVLFVLILIVAIGALFGDRGAVTALASGVAALVFVGVAAATDVPVIEASTSGRPDVETSLQAGIFVAAAGGLLLVVAGGLGLASEAASGES
jgi:hypothetical protein